MTLRDTLEERGRWLFRYRGHLPLLLLPVFAAALLNSPSVPGARIGWEALCLVIAFAGLAVRAATVGFVPARTSGRNTAAQVADALNTTGMYSVVRHPLYLGNAIVLLGVTLLFSCWWLVLIVLLAFGLYYERIMLAEEAFLRRQFGDSFEAWAARVPAIVPNLRGWQRPALAILAALPSSAASTTARSPSSPPSPSCTTSATSPSPASSDPTRAPSATPSSPHSCSESVAFSRSAPQSCACRGAETVRV